MIAKSTNSKKQIITLTAVFLALLAARAMDYTAVFDAPPQHVPTSYMPDGPLLGNGDLGVAIGGPPQEQSFFLGKNDSWQCKPAKVISVGMVRLHVPALQQASYRQEQDLARAEVRGTFTKGDLTVRTRSWVAASENLLVTEISCQGPTAVTVSVDQSPGGAEPTSEIDKRFGIRGPEDGTTASLCGTRRADPEAVTEGRSVTVATRVLDAATRLGPNNSLEFELRPGQPALIVSSALSDLDAADHAAAANKRLAALDAQSVARLSAEHQKWWSDFWARSFIEIPDKLIEKHWYGALYILACCSREGKVAPGLWGNWNTTDAPNWQGDYTLNYNFQAPYYIAHSANHVELTLPFYKAILDFMPKGLEMARTRGWKGVHFPTHIGPWALLPEGWQDWGQRSNAAYAAINFIWYYEYTQDKDWLKTTGYPLLIEVANFWEDYLKFENGRYVIQNDSIHENSGPDCNGVLSLGLVRTLFRSMLKFSQDLDTDADRRPKWQHILKHLKDQCEHHAYPNLILFYGGGGIESCGGFAALNEMLLQSHEGVIRLFPAWPKDLDARFGKLRTYGAFLVSAQRQGGLVAGVTIRSEKGRDCTVENPWPGRKIRLLRNAQPAETVGGDRVTFKTTAGEKIELTPQDSEQ
ncbi:MAG: hypothetical protein NTW21_42325 [Verrucomicrobia bacterium]|nr:hypothetical protein [Verrucomicrobiota bacterium]